MLPMPNIDQINGPDPIDEAFNSIGVTCIKVAKKYKKLMNAKVTKTQKLKGQVDEEKLGRGIKIFATSGGVETSENGNDYLVGDTVISWKEDDNRTQRESTRDVATMLGYFKDKGENGDKILDIRLVDFNESDYSESEKHGCKSPE